MAQYLFGVIAQNPDDSMPVLTQNREWVELQETNPTCSKRTVYLKWRPLRKLIGTKGLGRPAILYISQRRLFGHWAIEVGDYLWELIQEADGSIKFHRGRWVDPPQSLVDESREILQTKTSRCGETCLTDLQIDEKGQ